MSVSRELILPASVSINKTGNKAAAQNLKKLPRVNSKFSPTAVKRHVFL